MSMVDQAAGTASATTSDNNQNSFASPKSATPLREPDGDTVLPDAKSLRSYNRIEEAGGSTSRIRTTATGMSKEGIGNIFQGQGLVDSQRMSATGEGYFDNPPLPTNREDIPEPGPIPKDALSTLGTKK
jgi:hypothetical protein